MTVEFKDMGLKAFIRAFRGEVPQARVGILGENNHRKEEGPTNAEIGLKHEFGMDGLPVRSFLRVPLAEHLAKALDKAGGFDEETLRRVIATASARPLVEKIAIVAEGVVLEAFATTGYGKWKPSDMRFKKVHQTLVETQQLRNSITSEVVG